MTETVSQCIKLVEFTHDSPATALRKAAKWLDTNRVQLESIYHSTDEFGAHVRVYYRTYQ